MNTSSRPHSAYVARGFLAVVQGDPSGAKPPLERAIAAARDTGQLSLLALALSAASIAENMAGCSAPAGRLLDEASVVSANLDDVSARLGYLHARAAHSFQRRPCRRRGNVLRRVAAQPQAGYVYVLELMLTVATRDGEPVRAAQLLGTADTVRRRTGARFMSFLTPLVTDAEASAVARLGTARFEGAREAGRQMDHDAAMQFALGQPSCAAQLAPEAGVLARHESEVADLVADGLSNKQIGARLVISERTVEGHVRSILNTLSFNSRARIAGWVRSPHP